MKRALLLLCSGLPFGGAIPAQCLDVSAPGTSIGNGDDVQFGPHYPLGFAFPIAGAAAPSYTHVRVCCNGWLCLTDGVTSVGFPSSYDGSVAQLTGSAGYAPRIMAFWHNLNLQVANQANVVIDNTSNPGQSCTIRWVHATDFPYTVVKSLAVELHANGAVQFSYSNGLGIESPGVAFVGISPGNGVAVPAPADLSSAGLTTDLCVYESFATGPVDLAGRSLIFVPTGPGWAWATLCAPAYHLRYGEGCYDWTAARSSFYQLVASASQASGALQGNGLRFSPTPDGYHVQWLPGGAAGYVAPTAAANVLPASDDGASLCTPSVPLVAPGGAAPQLTIGHNGIVTLGTVGNQGSDWSPTGAEFAAASRAAFYCWYDYDDTEAGSGRIKTEEIGGTLCITWDGVEGYNFPPYPDPHRFQFQFELATGVVTLVWPNLSPLSAAGRSHLVGYRGAGVVLDPGSIDLTSTPPFVTAPDLRLPPLQLTATPPPVNDGVQGTLVTFTVENVPAWHQSSPSSPHYAALLLSTGASPGVDLGFAGAPGCRSYLMALEASVPVGPSTGASQSVALLFPGGSLVPPGSDIWVQAIAAFDPGAGLLPNGQNALGVVTSNGLQCHVESQ